VNLMAEGIEFLSFYLHRYWRAAFSTPPLPVLGVGEITHTPAPAGLAVFDLEIRMFDLFLVPEPPVMAQERAVKLSYCLILSF